jgi:hypothetical protein
MFISNAKYEKRHGGTRNKRYFPEAQSQTGIDLSDFEIPRYEEMKFLRLEDFEE